MPPLTTRHAGVMGLYGLGQHIPPWVGIELSFLPPFSDLVWSALGFAGAVLLRGVVNVPPPFRLVIQRDFDS